MARGFRPTPRARIYNRLRIYTDRETLVRVPSYLKDPKRVDGFVNRERNPGAKLSEILANLRAAETGAVDHDVALATRGLNAAGGSVIMDASTPADPRPGPLDLVRHEQVAGVLAVFTSLSPLLAYVLSRKFGLGEPQAETNEISRELGYTTKHVRMLEEQGRSVNSKTLCSTVNLRVTIRFSSRGFDME